MLLQAAGKSNALRTMLKPEIDAASVAIRGLRARLRQPPKTQSEYIHMLTNKLRMPRTAQILQTHTSRF